MRLLPNIDYGTQRYTERVARRLRVLNFTAWCASLLVSIFVVYQLFDPRLWTLASFNVLFATFLATIPLWHRFGALAGPIVYVIGVYTAIFVICSRVGTDSGMQMQYLAVAAGVILVLGTERLLLPVICSTLAVALIIALELLIPHDTGLLSRSAMLENFVMCVIGTSSILFMVVFYAVQQASRAEDIAAREYERSEALLSNILPASVASRLKNSSAVVIADKYDEASVLFADLAGFTARASDTAPVDLIAFLNEVFTAFDRLVESHGLEKIKTTGDSYMVVSGVPASRADHAEALAQLALNMLKVARDLHDPHGDRVPLRIGIASGPVVAGVVGTRKFFYDVWGDAVNVASRMESTGIPDKIQVSQEAYARLKDGFLFEARGLIDVRGKGKMPTWFLNGQKRLEILPGTTLDAGGQVTS
jgi:adenylate cyclase